MTPKRAAYDFTFAVRGPASTHEQLLRKSLPEDISYNATRGSKEPRAFLVLHIDERVSGDSAKHMAKFVVNREYDRFYFLTAFDLQPSLVPASAQLIGPHARSPYFPRKPCFQPNTERVAPQRWDDKIETMLHFWRLAMEEVLRPAARIILLYQIVESVAAPRDQKLYPPYKGSQSEPNAYTEAKLLRHLIAHQHDQVKPELANYRRWLGLPSLKPCDEKAWQVVARRIPKLLNLAASLIDKRITRDRDLGALADEGKSHSGKPAVEYIYTVRRAPDRLFEASQLICRIPRQALTSRPRL